MAIGWMRQKNFELQNMEVVKIFDNYFSANLVLSRLANDRIRCTHKLSYT